MSKRPSRKAKATSDVPFDPDGWADAILQADSMECQADYRKRGRHFDKVALSDLGKRWVPSVRSCRKSDSAAASLELVDLSAEFTLRQQEPPYPEVAAEIQAAIEEEGPKSFVPGVRRFRRSLGGPKH
jgi:hypothetical protein